MDYRTKSFWLEGAYADYTPNPALEGDRRYDFAIAGGGFTGMSAAYFLKKHEPGMKIAILESQVIGFGASGRNDGFNMTLLGENILELARLAGEDNARAAHAWAKEAVDTVHGLVQEHGIDCDYEHNGFLLIGLSKPHIAKVRKETDMHIRLGTQAEYLDAEGVRALLPSTPAVAGMREPHCGILNPAKYCRGMKRVLTDMGVEIFENTRVTRLEQGRDIVLHTPGGRASAPAGMAAANAYSASLGLFRRHVFPLFTYIVLTEPLTDRQLDAIGWAGRWGIETARRFVHYFRLTADNRISIGGGSALYYFNYNTTRDRNEKVFAQVEQALVDLFPPLKGIRFTHRWGGPVACTFDFFPIAGVMGEHRNLYYSTGYTGHGVSLANASGKIIRDLYFNQDTHRTRLFFINRRPFGFPAEPLLYPAVRSYAGYLRFRDTLDGMRGGA